MVSLVSRQRRKLLVTCRVAFSRLILFASILLCFSQSVYAGQWNIAYTYSGSGSAVWPNGRTDKDWNNGGMTPGGPFGPVPNGSPFSATSSGTVTATLTWVPSVVDDIPPPELILIETAVCAWEGQASPAYYGASWSLTGTATNPIGTYQPLVYSSQRKAGRNYGYRLVTVPASSGQIVRTCSLNASFNGTFTGPGGGSGGITEMNFSVMIHAHPYDFRVDRAAIAAENAARRAGQPYQHPNYGQNFLGVSSGGELMIPYLWKSTSGNLADLGLINIYEMILWSGDGNNIISNNIGYFEPYNPPFVSSGWGLSSWARPNPYNGKDLNELTNASRGFILDRHSKGGSLYVPGGKGATISGRTYFSYEGRQNWVFDCTICSIVAQRVPSVTGESGLNPILREYFKLPPDVCPCPEEPYTDFWRYRTSKHGFTAWEDWMYVINMGPIPFYSNFLNP